jgi:DNA invertase Pin-like site-specific DNA recombinase
MKYGYMRISTEDQKLDMQEDALKQAGCEYIFSDRASGVQADRVGLQQVLEKLQEGDCLVVYKLDRLGRNLKHLIEIITDLQHRKIGFVSLSENLNTTTAGGMLIFNIFASIAAFERELIRERTMSGLSSARARGRKGGRPKALSEKQLEVLRTLKADHSLSVSQITGMMGISRSTYFRAA